METDTNSTQQGIFDRFRANQNLVNTNQLENSSQITLPPQNASNIPEPLTQFTQTSPDTQARQQRLEQGQAQNQGTLGDIFTGLTTLGTKGATQTALEEQAGIPTLNKELTDIENELRQKDLEFRRQREAIQITPGLTQAQIQARLGDVTRKQSSQLADLEVIRQARSNSLTNAQSLIDKKVALKFADVQANIDALKFIYDENKDRLTTEEKNLLDERIKREDRSYELAKNEFEDLEKQKIDLVKNAQANGASNQVMSAIMQSKNIEEAYRNAGRFGVSIDDKIRQAQLNKIRTELSNLNLSEEEADVASETADRVSNIDTILNNDGLSSAVGVNAVARRGFLRAGKKQDFIAGVEQLTGKLTLQSLIDAKKNGATFGALSDSELKILAGSATRIGTWAKKDKNGNIVGYKVSEQAFKNELNKIKELAKKDFEKRTGISYDQFNQQTQTGISVDDFGNVVIPGELSNEDYFNQ